MRVRIIAAVVLVSATALGVLLLLRGRRTVDPGPPPPPDPRLEYTGPFRNVHPSIRYVSDSRCAECHPEIAASYAGHPMARSLFPVDRAPVPPTGAEANNPFEAFGTRFLVEYQKGRVRHLRTRLDRSGREGAPAIERQWEVHYVVGSGTRGYSYFTDRGGYLFQTPISWYSQKNKGWDLSPGFDPTLLRGRAVMPECLFCHADRTNHVEGSVNRYTAPVFEGYAIGCQRCHGPGELHVGRKDEGRRMKEEKEKKRSDSSFILPPSSFRGDPTIVNPKYLAANLRDAVCEQCHLQGVARVLGHGRGVYDFRPGLPLESCWSVFVRAAEAAPGHEAGSRRGQKAVGQVEQMYESRCFQRSREGPVPLGCVSCHDPHARVPPDRVAAHYRSRCLQCHRGAGGGADQPRRAPACSLPPADRLPRTAEDSCIVCHMPRYGASDIPHTAVTDHRILRGGKPAPRADEGPRPGGEIPVVSFYGGRKGVDAEEDNRSRAIAVERLALTGDPAAARVVRSVLPVLEAAFRRDPHDLPAGEALGYALAVQDRFTEALAAFQAVLVKAPDRELALVGAGAAAEALGQGEAALDYWRRASVANPWAAGYRERLALLLVKNEAWDAARPECEAWVRLDPFSAEARTARVSCLLAAGAREEARAEFARIEALAPQNLRELRIRFGKKLRRE